MGDKAGQGNPLFGDLAAGDPACPSDVPLYQSPEKRDGIIDDDDLLMMRRTQGMVAVEAKMDPSVTAPGMAMKNDFAIGGIDHREIPQEHINAEFPITAHQIVQEVSEAWKRISRIETEPAIELQPAMKITLCAF